MCRICSYNQVKDLDRLLLAGVTPVELSRKYAFSSAELQYHQQHLQQKMALVSQRFHASLDQGFFCQLHTVMAMVLSVVRRTTSGDDPKLFLQASREFTRILSLMHKMSARLQFDPEFIHCLMASHEWDLQEANLLPNAFQALNRSRQTMKQYLFAPCPEPEPASAPEPAPDSKVKALPSHRANKPGRHSLDHLSETSASPARQPGQETSPGESPPENIRDTSATAARQERQNRALSSKLGNNLNKIYSIKKFFRKSAD